jgi:hypothetical protein
MKLRLRADGTREPASVTKSLRGVAESFANDSFALLGVTTVGLGRDGDREAWRSSLKGSRLPARFWWDIGQDNKPGPIQIAWNARMDLYVLDHRGVIRYKHVLRPELFEKAVATLLKEKKDEVGQAKKIKRIRALGHLLWTLDVLITLVVRIVSGTMEAVLR